MTATRSAWRRPPAWLGISAVDCAAHNMNSLGPFAVNALMDGRHLDALQAGIWTVVEILSYAAAMLAMAPVAGRVRLRPLALLAAAIASAAQAGSALTGSYAVLLSLRVASGLGLGGLNAVVNIASARSPSPQRTLSLVMVAQTVVFSAAGLVLPLAGQVGGQAGIFGALALLIVAMMPAMTLLPATVPAVSADPGAAGARVVAPSAGAVRGRAALVLAAVALYTGGSLAVWPFTVHIGQSVGLGGGAFGRLTVAANMLGLAFCLLGVALGERPAAARLLLPALGITGVACVVQAHPPGAALFVAAFLCNFALWFMIYPGLIAMTCRIDSSGRLATAASGIWMVSQALTTTLAGYCGRNGQFLTVGIGSLVACILAAGFLAVFASCRVHSTREAGEGRDVLPAIH